LWQRTFILTNQGNLFESITGTRLGLEKTNHAALDSAIFIEIRDKGVKAKVVKLPFYKKA
jgi:hypothetical protein